MTVEHEAHGSGQEVVAPVPARDGLDPAGVRPAIRLHVGERGDRGALGDAGEVLLLLLLGECRLRRPRSRRHHHSRARLRPLLEAMAYAAGRDQIARQYASGFADLFDPEEGRMGVAVTFIAILELLKEAVIEVVQAEEYTPLHVRAASSVRLVADNDAAEQESQG